MRGEVAALIDQGKSHDEIIQWFVATYGSEEMLGAPLDKGFSRLAWLFPYLIGATSAAAIGFAAVKWTRRLETAPDAPAPTDPRWKNASTMSSGTSIKSAEAGLGLEPWQFFVLAALLVSTGVILYNFFGSGGQSRSSIILFTVLMAAVCLVGIAALRAVRPLVSPQEDLTAMVGERTRAALEREKLLTLRSIKELEFDRAMGKLSDADWQEMSSRLRARAAGLMRQLDAGVGLSRADRARSGQATGRAAGPQRPDHGRRADLSSPRRRQLLHRVRHEERRRREVLQELRAQTVSNE